MKINYFHPQINSSFVILFATQTHTHTKVVVNAMLVVHKFALKWNVCQLLHKVAILQLHDMAWLSINRIYYTQCQRNCVYSSAFVHDEFIFIDTQQTTRQLNRSLRFNVINVNLIKSKI